MQEQTVKVVRKIHSAPGQVIISLTTAGVYAALFLLLLHTGFVQQREFLNAFANAFLATWFLCGLLALLLVLFLLKDLMQMLKDLFINTAESIYGSLILISAFSLAGYIYTIPASHPKVLGHKTSFLLAFIVYMLAAIYVKKIINTMASVRGIKSKITLILFVVASFALTWFAKTA